jgi:hypothetical protein
MKYRGRKFSVEYIPAAENLVNFVIKPLNPKAIFFKINKLILESNHLSCR